MWRTNRFQENADSDQSISEEEDFIDDLGENCISLGDRLEKEKEKEEGLQLQSRLEILKEKCDNNRSYNQEPSSFYLEEYVEVPDSPDEGVCSSRKIVTRCSDEELISDCEENVRCSVFSTASDAKETDHCYEIGEEDGEKVLPIVPKEVKALVHLDRYISSSSSHSKLSKTEKAYKGAKSKLKPKFSFGFQLYKGVSRPAISNNEYDVSTKLSEKTERLKAKTNGIVDHQIPKLLEDFHGKEEEQLEIVPADVEALDHGYIEHSMAELLDGLQDNASGMLRGNSKMYSIARGKKVQAALKRSIHPLGDRIVEREDLHEPLSGGSSSNDEADNQNLELAIPEMKKRTISDKFQEALGATSLSDEVAFFSRPKAFNNGLFGKLQQVMQREKAIDTHFLKKLHNGASLKNDTSCINVKIVSRYLDAKLTVCSCYFVESIEGFWQLDRPELLENEGRKGTIIFNQRICSDVDLEIGNLICIHSPWKEVDVMVEGERVILSTYFSKILT